jgi:hypothetical protein
MHWISLLVLGVWTNARNEMRLFFIIVELHTYDFLHIAWGVNFPMWGYGFDYLGSYIETPTTNSTSVFLTLLSNDAPVKISTNFTDHNIFFGTRHRTTYSSSNIRNNNPSNDKLNWNNILTSTSCLSVSFPAHVLLL